MNKNSIIGILVLFLFIGIIVLGLRLESQKIEKERIALNELRERNDDFADYLKSISNSRNNR